jgi:hypothetical protein
MVGIFWMVKNEPVIDSVPVSEAEVYADHKTHPRDHYTVWGQLQRNGRVPREMDYAEMPRGRVMFDCKEQRFSFLADRCILAKKSMVTRIMKAMHLPPGNVKTGTDPHYRCYACLGWVL